MASNRNTWEIINLEDAERHFERYGVSRKEEYFKEKLKSWRQININIGVTGKAGVGKSSFINAIRELEDSDERAAATGVDETTREVISYPHPTNSMIHFWDLPGVGSLTHPDLQTYCKNVNLEKFDTFLIFNCQRFTKNDLDLAKKVKSINKSFFFIRTKIDIDVDNEKHKLNDKFNEEEMLNGVKDTCKKSLQGLLKTSEEVFLVSNRYPEKWDFSRLTQAILDALPARQRECLTLTLGALTNLSMDIVKRKVEVLRGRIWMVASSSAVGATVPLPGVSIALDYVLLRNEVELYKSQLRLPTEDSREFRKMTAELQKKIQKFSFTNQKEIEKLLASYSAKCAVEEAVRYIPVVGELIAASISFLATFTFLHECLAQMEKTALAFLNETKTRTEKDLNVDQ